MGDVFCFYYSPMMETEALPSGDSESDAESESGSIDLSKLRPYEFEPEMSDESNDSSDDNNESEQVSSGEEDDDVNVARIGNTTCCTCDRCRSMTTYEESICCKEDVPEYMLGEHLCITAHEDFSTVCLNNAVLRTTEHAE